MRSRYIFLFLSGQSAVRIPCAICALVCSQFANSAAKSAIRHKVPKKTCREMGKRARGTQSCRITCKFSTSPSIGWHGTSFDQKLTAQQYTEAFINVRRCRMQRCHWQMPYLSHSVYLSLLPSVPRWQHNKSSVNWFQNFNGKKRKCKDSYAALAEQSECSERILAACSPK